MAVPDGRTDGHAAEAEAAKDEEAEAVGDDQEELQEEDDDTRAVPMRAYELVGPARAPAPAPTPRLPRDDQSLDASIEPSAPPAAAASPPQDLLNMSAIAPLSEADGVHAKNVSTYRLRLKALHRKMRAVGHETVEAEKLSRSDRLIRTSLRGSLNASQLPATSQGEACVPPLPHAEHPP